MPNAVGRARARGVGGRHGRRRTRRAPRAAVRRTASYRPRPVESGAAAAQAREHAPEHLGRHRAVAALGEEPRDAAHLAGSVRSARPRGLRDARGHQGICDVRDAHDTYHQPHGRQDPLGRARRGEHRRREGHSGDAAWRARRGRRDRVAAPRARPRRSRQARHRARARLVRGAARRPRGRRRLQPAAEPPARAVVDPRGRGRQARAVREADRPERGRGPRSCSRCATAPAS